MATIHDKASEVFAGDPNTNTNKIKYDKTAHIANNTTKNKIILRVVICIISPHSLRRHIVRK
jgi:hypothetical protein